MMNRTEAIIVTAAIALATLPRFEAKVEQYSNAHRTGIRMAVNQLEGKPAIPFAAPEGAPNVELALKQDQDTAADAAVRVHSREALRHSMLLAREQDAAELTAERVRSQVAGLQVSIPAQVQQQIAQLQPHLAVLHMVAERNPHGFKFYRLKAKGCPEPPAVPAAPVAEIPSASSTY